MLKINGKMLEVKGKGVHRTTKFEREIKRLEWSVKEKGGNRKGVFENVTWGSQLSC